MYTLLNYNSLETVERANHLNIEMKTARCKITELKDELLEHVKTTIHKPAPGNQLTDIFSMIVL